MRMMFIHSCIIAVLLFVLTGFLDDDHPSTGKSRLSPEDQQQLEEYRSTICHLDHSDPENFEEIILPEDEIMHLANVNHDSV